MPDADFVLVERCGHMIPVERPEAFAAAIAGLARPALNDAGGASPSGGFRRHAQLPRRILVHCICVILARGSARRRGDGCGVMQDWIGRLFENHDLTRMGHGQRVEDLNLGLGWVYYGLRAPCARGRPW